MIVSGNRMSIVLCNPASQGKPHARARSARAAPCSRSMIAFFAKRAKKRYIFCPFGDRSQR
jgi:hypothetical protein